MQKRASMDYILMKIVWNRKPKINEIEEKSFFIFGTGITFFSIIYVNGNHYSDNQPSVDRGFVDSQIDDTAYAKAG